jgi:hypothetical protein
MTLNDQIDALVLKNKVIKPVNMTAFKNPFLLLSTTRALNELVSNTAPSDRARQQGIEDDKAYLKTPTGAKSDRKAPKKDEKQDTQLTRQDGKPDGRSAVARAAKKAAAAKAAKTQPQVRGPPESVKEPTPTQTTKSGTIDGMSKAARAAKKANAKKAEEALKRADGKGAMGRKQGVAESIPDEADSSYSRLRGGNRRLGTKKTQKKKK